MTKMRYTAMAAAALLTVALVGCGKKEEAAPAAAPAKASMSW